MVDLRRTRSGHLRGDPSSSLRHRRHTTDPRHPRGAVPAPSAPWDHLSGGQRRHQDAQRHDRSRILWVWVPIIRSWALARGFALHPGTRNRYEIRYTRTQHRPPSRQANDHGRVSGTHRPAFLAARGRTATSPDTATPEPLNKVKGRFPPATHHAPRACQSWFISEHHLRVELRRRTRVETLWDVATSPPGASRGRACAGVRCSRNPGACACGSRSARWWRCIWGWWRCRRAFGGGSL